MSKFKKYPKIIRLGAEDVDDILIGKCIIQEKLDGANVSLWVEGGEVQCGSRNNHLVGNDFNGFVTYVKEHKGIQKLLKDHPEYRLYGEWLLRHSISYNETAYRKMYMYDIWIDGDDELDEDGDVKTNKSTKLTIDEVNQIAEEYGILTPHLFGTFENPTIEQLNEVIGKSTLGDNGEGIVIKNADFVNKWGNRPYAKLVVEKFKELNALVFGGNNKHSDTYHEMWCVNKFVTLARVEKIMKKLQPSIDKRLGMEHTARIINTVYKDVIDEEIWTIQKKCSVINFKTLSRLVQRKAAQVYHDLLNNNISVADK